MEKPKTIQRVALVSKMHLDRRGIALTKKIVRFLENKKVEILYEKNTSDHLGETHPVTSRTDIMETADLVITLGGDGTLIKLAQHAGHHPVPILSINLGNVGFLTEVQKLDGTFTALQSILNGKYTLDVRSMLRVTVYRKGKKNDTFLALNEAVINQGNFARLIELTAEINQRRMVRFKADGLIIASPTGSTGHSLSAGGPIVHPKIEAIVFTPICPATLAIRPIVIPSSRELTITIETQRRFKETDLALTVDGQRIKKLKYGDEVRIRHSSRSFVLARITNTKYYRALREHLGWGE